jgi:hypothetical protein
MAQLTKELLELAHRLYDAGESPNAGLKALKDHVESKQQTDAAGRRRLKPQEDSTRLV